jgi:polyhydroxybutyrate depolymerase
MKHIYILLFSLAAISTTALAQTRFDVTMRVDSVQRQFIVVRPSGPAPAGGYPMVVVFHGTSGDGEKFYNISGWKEKGEVEKIITVFPSSLEYCIIEDSVQKRTTKWNNGDLQMVACPGQNLKDDIHFMRRMIDSITSVFPIDRTRIFATGHSNGGVFTSKLSIDMSDVFSAVATVAGPLLPPDSAAPVRKIPTWFMIGTLDRTVVADVPGEPGLPEVPFNDSGVVYLGRLLRLFRGPLGLDTTYTKDSISIFLTYKYTTPLVPGPTAPFFFTLVNDMEHLYPNGTNASFTAANLFWEFFTQSTSSVPQTGEVRSNLTIYPNPAHDYLIVDGEGDITLSLRTVLGQKVFTTTGSRGRRIDLPNLANGAYIAEIVDPHTRSTTMVLLR